MKILCHWHEVVSIEGYLGCYREDQAVLISVDSQDLVALVEAWRESLHSIVTNPALAFLLLAPLAAFPVLGALAWSRPSMV